MEKKTIGKFIAALRKANGMTQKELGEKLFVSDKTVSRWERDECEPELSVLPAMAELFGVTTDELIRGERIPATPVLKNFSPEQEARATAKTEKQLKRLLTGRKENYRKRLALLLGLEIVGLLVAALCNFAFYRATLGFCISLIVTVVTVFLLVLFSEQTYLKPSEIEDTPIDKQTLLEFHSSLTVLCRNHALGILCCFVATLPLAFTGTYFGLTLPAWLLYGGICVLAMAILSFAVYKIVIEKRCIQKNLLQISEAQKRKNARRKLALRRYGIPCGCIFAVGVIAFVVCVNTHSPYRLAEKIIFEDFASFKEYIETYTPSYIYDKDKVWGQDEIIGDSEKTENPEYGHTHYYREVYDDNHNLLYTYEWNNQSVWNVEFSNAADRLPIIVYTKAAVYEAEDTLSTIGNICFLVAVVDAAVFVVAYLFTIHKEN